jgi:NAD+ synthase
MEIEEKIVNWIKKQVKKTKAKGVVLGLSGGIDSAVVALLCKKAVGDAHLCLILDCESNQSDIEDANFLVKKFKLKRKYIDLTEVYKNLLNILPPSDRKTKANLKPRLRMAVLYYFANKYNFLVVGTGNKSEISVGYFTKYGDGGVDILPIGDLYKTEVRELAKKLKIPERILNKPPSAGLWEGQTDEDELGISYNELDKILDFLQKGKKIKIEKKKIEKVKKLLLNSQHKREMPGIFKKN